MSIEARNKVDHDNMLLMNKVTTGYPIIVRKYLNSLSRKTSHTKLAYARYICYFLDYMNSSLNNNIFDENNYKNVRPMDIDAYMEFIRYDHNGNEKSGMYRAAQLAALKGFFKFLKKNNIICTNPCDDTEIPKDTKEHEIVTISSDDYRKILDNIKYGVGNSKAVETQRKWRSRDLAILLIGITTGLRASAIINMDVDDINFDDKSINVVEKGNVKRKVYFGNNTNDALVAWLKDRDCMLGKSDEKAVFVSQYKTRISKRSLENLISRITYNTSVKITPHKMRSTCATRLYEQTGDIYLVQEQLGHKNIKNTERYARMSDTRKRSAADVLDSLL